MAIVLANEVNHLLEPRPTEEKNQIITSDNNVITEILLKSQMSFHLDVFQQNATALNHSIVRFSEPFESEKKTLFFGNSFKFQKNL